MRCIDIAGFHDCLRFGWITKPKRAGPRGLSVATCLTPQRSAFSDAFRRRRSACDHRRYPVPAGDSGDHADPAGRVSCRAVGRPTRRSDCSEPNCHPLSLTRPWLGAGETRDEGNIPYIHRLNICYDDRDATGCPTPRSAGPRLLASRAVRPTSCKDCCDEPLRGSLHILSRRSSFGIAAPPPPHTNLG